MKFLAQIELVLFLGEFDDFPFCRVEQIFSIGTIGLEQHNGTIKRSSQDIILNICQYLAVPF